MPVFYIYRNVNTVTRFHFYRIPAFFLIKPSAGYTY